ALLALRKMFRERVDANWRAARGPVAVTVTGGSSSEIVLQEHTEEGTDADDPVEHLTDAGEGDALLRTERPPIIVGFAQVPAAGPH
ncbi:hypothetical protein, partial [Hoeflea sp.]|uniref:hypothetical protein n=1 Tax=Hoeflea sp. TaxID=1940281 RepID=UPI0025BF3FA5